VPEAAKTHSRSPPPPPRQPDSARHLQSRFVKTPKCAIGLNANPINNGRITTRARFLIRHSVSPENARRVSITSQHQSRCRVITPRGASKTLSPTSPWLSFISRMDAIRAGVIPILAFSGVPGEATCEGKVASPSVGWPTPRENACERGSLIS